MFVSCVCVCSGCQVSWSLSKMELLFIDFCEDGDNIEDGAEYNKVPWYSSTSSQAMTTSLKSMFTFI